MFLMEDDFNAISLIAHYVFPISFREYMRVLHKFEGGGMGGDGLG